MSLTKRKRSNGIDCPKWAGISCQTDESHGSSESVQTL